MPLTNTAKPTNTLTNGARVLDYETWATISTTWASETRTWAETATLLDNTAKPTTTITNVAKP